MDPDEYTRMGELEGSMWWFKGLHRNVIDALQINTSGFSTLLDAGCGTGGMLQAIRSKFPEALLHGLDLSDQACAEASRKSGAEVTTGSVDALGHPSNSFDVLISLDVLGYEMDLDAAVNGFFRVLRPGGHLILNLAAYQWMLSYHDRSVGQTKRFTRSEAKALLARHGFKVSSASYWNTFLFPLMVLRRKVFPSPTVSDVTPFHPVVNEVFSSCLSLESALMRSGLRFPFGGSIFIVAERPGT